MKKQIRDSAAQEEQEDYSISTQIRNSLFTSEVGAFMRPVFPCNPLPFAYALVDALRATGPAFIKTDDAKALLHILMSQAHGQGYQLDGFREHDRLTAIFRK